MNYPTTPQEYTQLLKLSVKHYIRTFARIFLFILLIVLAKWVLLAIPQLPQSVGIPIKIIFYLIILYLICSSIYTIHTLWQNQSLTVSAILQFVLKKLLPVILSLLMIGLVIFLLVVSVRLVLFSFIHVNPMLIAFLTSVVISLPTIAIILFSFFVIPLLLMQDISIKNAFKQSALYTAKNWFGVFVLYLILGSLIAFLLPSSKHALWLQQHYLLQLSDLVVLSIVLPILFNLLLLLLNDLKLRL